MVLIYFKETPISIFDKAPGILRRLSETLEANFETILSFPTHKFKSVSIDAKLPA
jgi:hypothetical protein